MVLIAIQLLSLSASVLFVFKKGEYIMSKILIRTGLAALAAVVIAAVVLIVLISLPGNTPAANADEEVRDILVALEESTRAAMEDDPMLAVSSNPYDYIANGRNEYYNYIVAMGPVALPELERALMRSDQGGLTDYLVCIAIEEVSGADVRAICQDPFAWSTSFEFRDNWVAIRDSLPVTIQEILRSSVMSNQQKMERISAYGLLAVPVLKDALQQGGLNESLVTLVKEYLAARPLTNAELDALR